MPKIKAGITVAAPVTSYGLGKSDSRTMKTVYPASPVYDGSYSRDEDVHKIFEDKTGLTTGTINDGGYAFGDINRTYQDAPNLEEVETGGGGKPGTPWSPNPGVSPGGTDPHNPVNIPEPAELNRPGGGAGIGNGLTSPSQTSKYIASTGRKIGDALQLGDGSDNTFRTRAGT